MKLTSAMIKQRGMELGPDGVGTPPSTGSKKRRR